MKLAVLPSIVTANLTANMMGDVSTQTPKLYTEKLAGGIKACVGFVASQLDGYAPNTLLNADIRDIAPVTHRIIAPFRKRRSDSRYEEIVYRAKNVDWDAVILPAEYSYLKEICASKS